MVYSIAGRACHWRQGPCAVQSWVIPKHVHGPCLPHVVAGVELCQGPECRQDQGTAQCRPAAHWLCPDGRHEPNKAHHAYWTKCLSWPWMTLTATWVRAWHDECMYSISTWFNKLWSAIMTRKVSRVSLITLLSKHLHTAIASLAYILEISEGTLALLVTSFSVGSSTVTTGFMSEDLIVAFLVGKGSYLNGYWLPPWSPAVEDLGQEKERASCVKGLHH